MVAAGLDTVPGNLIRGITYLSYPHGQEIQQIAFDEIVKIYPDGDAWEKGLMEEKVPYATALVKEILRFWTVISICLPRRSIKDIPNEGTTIPAGATFYMASRVIVSTSQGLTRCMIDRTLGLPTTIRPSLNIWNSFCPSVN